MKTVAGDAGARASGRRSVGVHRADSAPAIACNICRSERLTLLIDFGDHPVSKHYLDTSEATPPVWPVRLYFCEDCGLTQLQNSCPPEVLYDNYVTLSSWKPQPHARVQIEKIVQSRELTPDSKIIEIGCNDGGFLQDLASAGYSRAVGVEPSRDAYEGARRKGLEVIPEFLTPSLARSIVAERGQFDLLISRQNLEHMADLAGVLECLDVLVRPGGIVLVELPNFACNLRWPDYSLWEEHVNYFTSDTLKHYLSRAGIEVYDEEVIRYSGEGLVVFGRRSGIARTSLDYLPGLRKANAEYAAAWPGFKARMQAYLAAERERGKRIAVYGAGSRAFCLLNFAGLNPYVDVIVDDQAEKQNHFMPGGRLPIAASKALYDRQIDLCLLGVNAENEQKVIAKHEAWTKKGEFWSVFPPSERLLPVWDEPAGLI